jgi:hypothetical protein
MIMDGMATVLECKPMFHDVKEYEDRAREAERLAYNTEDSILRQDLLALVRIYEDYAAHLRDRPGHEDDAAWRKAVNG